MTRYDPAVADGETLEEAQRGCPSRAELASLAYGGTAIAVDVASHVAGCARCGAIVAELARPQADALPSGTMVGRYRVLERLGAGGMGVVYRAIDTELDRPIALKLVRAHATDDLTERLRRESRLQARTKHPNVITVHDIGRDGDRIYVAMELAHGGTLREWLARAPRGWRDIVDVFRRAGEGLAAAHAAGLVHRDFKPDNVLVEGDGARVLVTDFGVARAIEAAEHAGARISATELMTMAGAVVGTPGYMAPEQLHAEPVDARTDVFAFGVGLWEALYGERPFAGESVAQLLAAMAAPLREPSQRCVPRWLGRVLRRALAIEPAERFATMAELGAALDWRRHRRRAVTIAAAAGSAGATLAAAALVLALGRTGEASPCDREPVGLAQLRAASAQLHARSADGLPPFRRRWLDAFDGYADVAAELRGGLCRAAPAARPANWRDRVRCLDRSTSAVAVFAAALTGAPPAELHDVMYAKPPEPPYACASDAAAQVIAALPPPLLEPRVAPLELAIARWYGSAASDPRRAIGELDRLAEQARALGFPPLVDEVEFECALIMVADPATRASRVREVARAAEHDSAYGVAARAYSLLAAIVMLTDLRSAHDVLASADLALDRAGNPPRERAFWHLYRAWVLAAESDSAGSAKEIAVARQVFAQGHVPPDLELDEGIGNAELRAGDVQDALVETDRVFRAVQDAPASAAFVVRARSNYAAALIGSSQPDRAREVLEPVLAGRDPQQPITSDVAAALHLLASAYNYLGRYRDTARLGATWRGAIARDLGNQTVHAGKLDVELATAALALGHDDEAERDAASALETFIELAGASAYDTADVRVLHGQALLKLRRFDEAGADIARGAADLIAAAGATDPLALQAQVALADIELRRGQSDVALATIQRVIEPYQKLEPDPGSRAYADLVLARALVAAHRELPRARALAAHAISVWQAAPPAWTAELADARALLKAR